MSSSSTCLVMALYIPFTQTVLIEHTIHPNHHPSCQVAESSADSQKRGRIKKNRERADELHPKKYGRYKTDFSAEKVTFRAPKTTFSGPKRWLFN
jgi:hypothetical protein